MASKLIPFVVLAFILSLTASLLPLTHAQEAKAPAAAATSGATGTWKWTVEGFGGQTETVLKLKQDGDKITGTISGFDGQDSPIADGKIKDGEITFKTVRDFGGRQVTTNYTGKLSGDSFKGKSETIFAQDFDAKRAQP